jgi:spore coat polysaccharide biosynthesis protein SpsF
MIAVVVQARTSSTRLPGKVLLPVAGQPLLRRMLERVAAARTDFEIVVATTTDPDDDAIARIASAANVRCHRGHVTDLLDRHYRAARVVGADVVVKIPSDCPLIDPAIIDLVLGDYLAHADEYDFVSNLHPATYPDGNDVEVLSMAALEIAWCQARRPHEREHTTPFVWDQPDRFRIGNVAWPAGLDYSMTHRFTVDYREDYDFVGAVYDALWSAGTIFTLEQILELLEEEPWIAELNRQLAGVNWYRHHLDVLRTVDHHHTVQR